MKSAPARWAKPGARILHLYGRLLPSLYRTSVRYLLRKKNWHVRDKVDTHLAFRRLDCRVGLARWDGVALAKELEVVDERLHALLHRGTRRWYKLVVIDLDGASRHFVQAL